MSKFQSTKVIELGSCAFRQPNAFHSHCRYVHGYKLTAKFWFGCSELDNKNWAVDFAALKELKNILQNQFDHTLCIDAQDPLLPLFTQLHEAGGCDLRVMTQGVGIERTAEWCFEAADKHVRELTSNRCWVEQVEVFEHELNSAIYRPSSTTQTTDVLVEPTTLNDLVETVIPDNIDVEIATQQTPQHFPQPAHVGPNVSSGKGDWFAGTSWGNR
jgi:6-pyruvoyltetrahydropterin/6-carboxytetrahydropterin synthase